MYNSKNKYARNSSTLSKEKNNLQIKLFPKLIKVIFTFILYLSSIYIINYDNHYIEKKLEKELEQVQPNYKALSWKNIGKDFKRLANKYKYLIKEEKNIEDDSPIFIMWYQGIENAPPIVKACVKSVIMNRAKHPVHIISKYNLEKYIKVPSYIYDKFKEKKFGIANFSDILRLGLIFKYGGYWIDATYFLTKPIENTNLSFYTIKLNHCWLKRHPFIYCKWSGNYMGVSKNSFIATYGYMAFLYYWKKYNSRIDYFLIDYIIHIAYTKVLEFKNIVNKIPAVSCSIFKLARKLKDNYDQVDFICPFNKLKKKLRSELNKRNKITNYGYMIKNFELKLNKTNDYIIH